MSDEVVPVFWRDEDFELDEMNQLRDALEAEHKRMRDLVEVLRSIGIEVFFSPDGLMVTDIRVESALRLEFLPTPRALPT